MGEFEARLDEIEARFRAVEAEMSLPEVAAEPDRLRTLGKTYAELGDVVRPYREYRAATAEAAEAHELAEYESDEEAASFYREEAERAEATAAELRAALELLLVPKDPNDGKDVIVEVR